MLTWVMPAPTSQPAAASPSAPVLAVPLGVTSPSALASADLPAVIGLSSPCTCH